MKNETRVCVVMILTVSVLAGSAAVSVGEGQGDDDSARANRTAERAAGRAAAKEKAVSRAEAARERREAAKEKALEAVKEKTQEAKAKVSETGSARVDKREGNQARRIQHGITKGYLTADEVTKLNTQQQSIAALESSLKSDGKLTVGEFRQLRNELNEASNCIWAEKHDTEGNQMPTYRLGKNVFAKSNLTSQLENENLSKADAKALLKDFRRTIELKRLLSGDASASDRARMQSEYDELLNKYFEEK